MQTTTQQQQQQPENPSYDEAAGGDPPLPGTDGREVRANFRLQLQVQALVATMINEEKMALGHSINDLIVDCEFAGTVCTSEYVK